MRRDSSRYGNFPKRQKSRERPWNRASPAFGKLWEHAGKCRVDLKKKKYDILSVGIGIDDGRALMVKAGYSGSGINDVIWMGDVVNTACHLANKAGRGIRNKIVVTEQIYNNLNDSHKKLLSEFVDGETTLYEGDIIRKDMDKWYNENCK